MMKIEVTTITTFNLVVNLETSTKSDNYDDFLDACARILEKNLFIITLNKVKLINLTKELVQKQQKRWGYLIKNNLEKNGRTFQKLS